jgi:hypothetical protein
LSDQEAAQNAGSGETGDSNCHEKCQPGDHEASTSNVSVPTAVWAIRCPADRVEITSFFMGLVIGAQAALITAFLIRKSPRFFKDGRMEEWKNGRMEGWKGGRVEGWKDGRMEGWKDGRMEGWKDGRMGIPAVVCEISNLALFPVNSRPARSAWSLRP